MIKGVHLKNFLSHKSTYIDLDPGLNVIVGPTDSGKSAVLRAINWVVNNRPTGDSFRSNWGGETRVTLFIDNYMIHRVKDGNNNLYVVDTKAGYCEEYEGFGQKVPEEVSKLLNMNVLNMQAQFDPHFLLTSSPGEVASHFNEVAHLSKIDSSIKNVNSWARKANQDLHYSQERLGHLEIELAELTFVEDLDDLVTDLEKIESEISKYEEQSVIINRQINFYDEICITMQKLNKVVPVQNHVESALVMQEQITSIQTQQKELSSLITSLKTLENVKQENLEFLQLENLVSLYNKVYKQIQEMARERKSLYNQLKEYYDVLRWQENAEDRLNWEEERYHEAMPEECPLCGTKIDNR